LKPESFEYWSPVRSVRIITGTFLEGGDSRGDLGLGKLVELRFKAPPVTTSSHITTHTPSGQRKYTSLSSQTQMAFTLQPCPGGRATKSTKDICWHWRKIYMHAMMYTVCHNSIY